MSSQRKHLPSIVFIAGALLALMVYIYPHPAVSHYKYEVGAPWNYADLMAPFDLDVYLDSATANVKVDSVKRNFVPIYTPSAINVDSLIRRANALLAAVPDSLSLTTAFSQASRRRDFAQVMARVIRSAYVRGVIPEPEQGAPDKIRIAVSPTEINSRPVADFMTPRKLFMTLDNEAKDYNCHTVLINSHIDEILEPSLVPDEQLNGRYLEQEKSKFLAPIGRIINGQKIIGKGEIVTEQAYSNIANYESKLADESGRSARSDLLMTLGQTLCIALLMLLYILYVYVYEPKVFASVKTMTFLLVMTSLFFAFQVLATWFISPGLGSYLVPLAIVPILTLVYLNGRLALATGAYLILLCAGLSSFPLEFTFIQATAMTAAVVSLRDLKQRSQLLKTSAIVTITLWLAYIAVNIMTNGSFDDFSLRMLAALTISGFLTAMAYIMMSVAERLFGFISNVTLVELADTNTPLLRKLSDECPGTFQHSVAVSNLAADAAHLIGANDLLVRAGALYHDIGKLSNPIFFTENQHGVNPHDGLTPQKSAEIIVSHVPEGLKRADKAGLPDVIKDFISQHHGAGKAKYFYIMACKQNDGADVDPAPFSYPGPNPKTREASVLMMADAVEAASRSLKEYPPDSIRQLVDRIIDSQIADGLHNDSDLSFRDVSTIKDAFARRLSTIYHTRIAYPDR